MVYLHVFDVDDEKIMIATSYVEEEDVIVADADIAVWEDVGKLEVDGEEKAISAPMIVTRSIMAGARSMA